MAMHRKPVRKTVANGRPKFHKKSSKTADESKEIEQLEARIGAGAPEPGSNPLAVQISAVLADSGVSEEFKPYVGVPLFEQLPISDGTRRALKDAGFTRMTAIQRAALPHALCGRDVLGAAKTGSGKTLAFLVPVVEKLYRLRWGRNDGIGAIIISPTRELAVQIFDELRKVGKYHSLGGGLLIGGRKGVDEERERINALNIIVTTPGRLLQHMDETPNFDCSQLQVLVLDEADRILDMGFSGTLNSILAQIPKERQTFLFSATQTRSVQDLARLSLQDPEYLAVHAESTVATPTRLQQTAMFVALHEKLDMLWSFVKTHIRSKTLVFLTSCKQVKFMHEVFKHLRPGVPVMCLHGRMKQTQRLESFFKFCQSKHSIMFATDVAARGLDFPIIDWVVQVDCPDDVASYIHRVGRTARYTAAGRSLLFLMPSEKIMLTALETAKIPMKVIKPNLNKVQHMSNAVAGLLSKFPDLKHMAQKAFVTYLRSLNKSKKEAFDVTKLPIDEFALSYGLPTTPHVRFLKKASLKKSNSPNISDGDMEINPLKEKETKKKSKLDRIFQRKNADILSSAYEKLREHNEDRNVDDGSGDEFLTKKRPREKFEQDQDVPISSMVKTSKPKKKRLRIDPSKAPGQRLVFDEEGNAVPPLAALVKEKSELGDNTVISLDASVAEERYKALRQEMKQHEKKDKLFEKERLREKRMKRKKKSKDPATIDEDADEGSSDKEPENLYPQRKLLSQDSDVSDMERSPTIEETGIGSLQVADQEALALKLLNSSG